MLVAATHAHLPELGRVWGNPDTYLNFKRTIQTQQPQHWEPLCSWFQNANRDRGFYSRSPSLKGFTFSREKPSSLA